MIENLRFEQFADHLSSRAAKEYIPIRVSIELSYGCNLACVHCYNPTHQALPQELKFSEIKEFLRQSRDLGAFIVGFTGGEPFVRPDALSIFRLAKDLGFEFTLLTNATRLTPSIVQELESIGPALISVSVYGMSEKTYEAMTQVKGSFQKYRQGIHLLMNSRLPLAFKMPLTILNVDELPIAQSFFLDMRQQFNHSVEIHPRMDHDLGPLKYRLSTAQAASLRSSYEDSLGCTAREQGESNPRKTEGNVLACSCGKNGFVISPYGEMNWCLSFPYPKYDLRQGTVAEGWRTLVELANKVVPTEHFKCGECRVATFCSQGAMDAFLEEKPMDSCLPYFYQVAEEICEKSGKGACQEA